MKLSLSVAGAAAVLAVAASAAPASLTRREVPQEHSHDLIVNAVRQIFIKDTQGFPDPIFALLGNAAALSALTPTTVTDKDPNNLQLHIADITITNCKKTTPVDPLCIARAVQFRALERNTPGVGTKSGAATAKPVNKELDEISQHQDPASDGAGQVNKEVEIAVARTLAGLGIEKGIAVGLALETATFAAGNRADSTGKGNVCDTNGSLDGQINVKLGKDTVDPVTGSLVKAGTIDCITAADLGQDPNNRSKRVPATTRQQLLDAIGGGTNGNQNQNQNSNTGNDTKQNPKPNENENKNQGQNGQAQTVTVTATVTATATVCPAATPAPSGPQPAPTPAAPAPAKIDLGTCTDAPTIAFGPSFDGRRENSFQPVNLRTFTHGSALNIDVIASFICDRLGDKCQAKEAQSVCKRVAAELQKSGDRSGKAADVFNRAFGVVTEFEKVK
ncbi:uncharacterized protein EV422DRAFT_349639 [Fimicolochytrium jonesii]|uniref:uncharacterized protein n=1 Tax=Fimicolochytrium jonesii TaxID=1396493 RepID=UPI0022FF02BE|nr:uncharacterized protein EV422DRAFT_349639 [Fimicolochytrium jonesii]KAI8815616.1 hypothetical protein EV422DRAFT_349639 [Fimicolochytrium jonesii]